MNTGTGSDSDRTVLSFEIACVDFFRYRSDFQSRVPETLPENVQDWHYMVRVRYEVGGFEIKILAPLRGATSFLI